MALDRSIHGNRANCRQGGHFAALEKPEDIKADLSEFVDRVWK